MPDGVMQRMRVGAANGLGAKFLARQDAHTVAILGTGWQAGAQLMAICAVRDIKQVRAFSPNREHRETFAREMSEALGIDVTPAAQPEEAIRGADVVMCASNSLDAIYFEHWVEPGVHMSSIKQPEIEVKALKRADRIALHYHEESPIHVTAKDFALAQKAIEHGWSMGKEIDFAKLPTLLDLIMGKAQGRQSDSEITCFMNNVGLGYQFAAAGSVVYRKAVEAGLGHKLPTEWFTEDVHP
jgi:ornithine cyclodeaminase/alanine dehydrogenase-like protein (mu-crystallin family)